MKNCEYCKTEQSGEYCDRCGAKLPENKREEWKSEPFFYNGYICYMLRDFAEDAREVQFWLGHELIERIKVSGVILEQHVPDYCDAMPFFWDLFLVAHGEKEVLEWKEKNNKYPATFEVRRIENPEKVRLWGLSPLDIVEEQRR